MKRIIDFTLNNKLAVWILTIIVIVAGVYAGMNMKQETIPNIELPNLSISAPYPGASPDVVAEDVTEPLESRLQEVSGVEMTQSSSLANASSITLSFDYDTDMDHATADVQEAISEVSLPEMVNDPAVNRINLDALPILVSSISDKDRSLEELTDTIENDVVPELEGVDGLSDVLVTGQQAREVSLTFDEDALEENGLDEDTIEQLIEASKLTYPLGLTTFDKEVKDVVIDGDITTLEDLENLPIPVTPEMPDGMEDDFTDPTGEEGMDQMPEQGAEDMPQGEDMDEAEMDVPTVPLKELADLEVNKIVDSISRTNGEESIGIQFVKASGANTVDVVNQINDKMETLEEDYGITAFSTLDQGEPIEDSINVMLEKALFGIVFAVAVILLFLRNIRTTLISVVSIPLSLLIAMFFMKQMDISLNILTLGALTVAIGRVIDDSIVVMENIYRRMSLADEKLRGKELVREATRQMFVPIFSSTIVTIAVFLPIALVGGMVGELFLPFALAIVFALAASLVVAVTIVPLLAHTLFKKRLNSKPAKTTRKQGHGKMANWYKRILNWTLDHKLITFGSATVVLIASLFIIPVIGTEFLADEEEKMIMATYSPEPGQTEEEAEDIVFAADDLIEGRTGVETYQFSMGGGNPMAAMGGGGGSDNSALFFMEYDQDFENFDEEQTDLIDELNDTSDQGEWNSMDFAGLGSGMQLNVYGNDLEHIEESVDQIMSVLEDNEDLEDLETSISEAYDQYTLVVDQDKLSENGLTAAQIGMALDQSDDANVFTTVEHDGEDLNVYVEMEKETYDDSKDLTKKELTTPLGEQITVADVVDVEEGKSPETIEYQDGKLYASITADITSRDTGGVSRAAEEDIDDLELAQGVTAEFGGVTEQMDEAFTQLGLSMLAAIAIVYFILVVTFGGGLAPFSILFSLPFTIIGSLVALWIADEPLGISSLIGALMLIGIVVTNAIVLIDRVIRNEKEGLSTREALLEAGGTRLRPILMTAFATIGALVPMLFGLEGGGLISKGLAVAVVGGLTSSTLLTLVIVPIVYEVFGRFNRKSA